MSRKLDIRGKRSGNLVAVEPTDRKQNGSVLWRCQCDCGRETFVPAYKISSGIITSCGCSRSEKRTLDLTGKRFGKLVARKRLDVKRGSSYLWECECDCGNTTQVSASALRSGNTNSCGCLRKTTMKETLDKCGTVAEHVTYVQGTCIEKIERKGTQRNNTSGYNGVQARGNRWVAVIGFQGKHYYLGIYNRLEDAVRARKAAEERLYGSFLEWYYASHPQKKTNQTA